MAVKGLREKMEGGSLTVRVDGEVAFKIEEVGERHSGLWIPLAPAEIDFLEAEAVRKGVEDAVAYIKRGLEKVIERGNIEVPKPTIDSMRFQA